MGQSQERENTAAPYGSGKACHRPCRQVVVSPHWLWKQSRCQTALSSLISPPPPPATPISLSPPPFPFLHSRCTGCWSISAPSNVSVHQNSVASSVHGREDEEDGWCAHQHRFGSATGSSSNEHDYYKAMIIPCSAGLGRPVVGASS